MLFGWRALQWANSFYNYYQNNPTRNYQANKLFCPKNKVIANIGIFRIQAEIQRETNTFDTFFIKLKYLDSVKSN